LALAMAGAARVGRLRHRRVRSHRGGGRRLPVRPGEVGTSYPASRELGRSREGGLAMADEPKGIRDQMQDTRTALTEKLEALEQTVPRTVETPPRPVVQTVQTVTEATRETVGTVKDTVRQVADTVSGAVETVKDTFNLPRQVQRHPWGMMFGSAAAGFL